MKAFRIWLDQNSRHSYAMKTDLTFEEGPLTYNGEETLNTVAIQIIGMEKGRKEDRLQNFQ